MKDEDDNDGVGKSRPLGARNPRDPDLFVQNYNKLPDISFALLNTDERVVIMIKRGEDGYYPVNGGKPFADKEVARTFAKAQNSKLGVTNAQASAMKNGSMFGFDTRAANPDDDCNQHEDLV